VQASRDDPGICDSVPLQLVAHQIQDQGAVRINSRVAGAARSPICELDEAYVRCADRIGLRGLLLYCLELHQIQ